MKRGQITFEYLLVIVVLILLFSGISLDLISESSSSASLLSQKLHERADTTLLKSSAELVSLQGSGAKKTLFIRAPKSCTLVVETSRVVEYCEPTSAPFAYGGTQLTPDFQGIAYRCVGCASGQYASSYACASCSDAGAKDYGTACSADAYCFKPQYSTGSVIKPSGELLEITK